jgi:hypothetical protein
MQEPNPNENSSNAMAGNSSSPVPVAAHLEIIDSPETSTIGGSARPVGHRGFRASDFYGTTDSLEESSPLVTRNCIVT